jgi:uncharacterized protein YjbJ (UPF0337 family)
MASDIMKGQWKQVKGEVQKRWGELTDDEVDQVKGESLRLAGLLQERYGYTKERAEGEIAKFLDERR